ncbi:MAG: ArsR family transcriptional regulator [Anaerolineae bacterium]|jgi:predicted ArsR family transcriptional regulator|nr:ArsR family transcriptional regulator [Anaerolineae bacterium]
MQDTRQQILEIMKRLGEVTVQDLSNELGLTSVTVRHHLEILRSEGYISDPEIVRSSRPGRPRFVYRLTSTAADLFPNNYSGLASALLGTIEECMAPAERDYLLERAANRIAERAGTLPDDPAVRVDSVVTFLNQQGYVSRWEESKEEKGQYLIHVSSCPYYHVSQAHKDVCQIDRYMVQLLAGPKSEVKRLTNAANRGGLCVYALSWPELHQ